MAQPVVSVQVAFETDPGETPIWTDITADAEVLRKFNVNRGRSSELDRFQAGRATITLANEDRRFDPTLGPSAQYVDLPGTNGNYLSTPDSTTFTDIDARIKVAADDWTPTNFSHLIGQYGASGQRSWRLGLNSSGTLGLAFSANGSTESFAGSYNPGLTNGAPIWIRFTRVASTAVFTVETSTDGIAWTVRQTGTLGTVGALPHNSTYPITVGADANGSVPLAGNIYYAEVRNGIGGPVIARFDPNAQRATAARTPATVTGGAGETWTFTGSGWTWGGLGTYAPYWPNVVPMRRIRIQATWDGVTYDIFSGYVDSWEQQYLPPEEAFCVVQATDAFKIFGNAELLSSVYAETIQSEGPVQWWRLGDAAGATTAVEQVTGNYPLEAVGSPTFGAASLSEDDPDGAVEFTTGADGLQRVFPEGTWPWATEGSVELLYQGTGPFGPRFAVINLGLWGMETLINFDDVEVNIYNNAGGVYNAMTSGVGINDGLPHHVVITWKVGSTTRIYVDGVDRTFTTGTVGGTMANTTNKWIVALNAVDYPPYAGTGDPGTYDEFSIWDRQLTLADVELHYGSIVNPWVGDTTGARINRLLDAQPWPAADRDIDDGASTLQAASLGGSILASMQKVEESEQGALFMGTDGAVRFIGRHEILSTTSQGTFGDSGSELEYGDLVYIYDDQLIFNEVQATREGGVTQVVGDQASQSRYMRRTKVFDGLLYVSDAEARGLGDWWVTHYKEPLLRATNMQLQPSAGNETTHFPQVLGRELMDRVTVRRRPQNWGSAIDQETIIEGISHDVTPEEWVTTWNLSPAEAQVYWLAEIAGHSEAGLTTIAGF